MRIWKLRSLDAENASRQLEQILHADEYNKPYRCNLNFIFYCIATFRCSTWIWKRRWINSSVCTPQPINISYIENCYWLCAYYSPECIHQPKNYSIVHRTKGERVNWILARAIQITCALILLHTYLLYITQPVRQIVIRLQAGHIIH